MDYPTCVELFLSPRGSMKLGGAFHLQPSSGDKKLVVALPPIPYEMHMGNSIPSDGASVFGHDDLKLCRYRIEECRESTENAADAVNIG